jgi:hypothetical protein
VSRHNKTAIIAKKVEAPKESQPSLRLKQLQKASGKGVLNDDLSTTARADFRVRVKYLQKLIRSEWNIQQFRGLGKKLYEIKWKSGDVQWRALGYDDTDGYFVVVKVCTHKMNVYTPPGRIDSARLAKTAAEAGTQKVIDYVL